MGFREFISQAPFPEPLNQVPLPHYGLPSWTPFTSLMKHLDILYDTEPFDQDGGLISVANTGINTLLLSIHQDYEVFLDQVSIVAYDNAALPVITWSLQQNSVNVYPWVQQRLTQGLLYHVVTIGRRFPPGTTLALVAQAPTTAITPFDLTGRMIGKIMGGFNARH